MSSDEFNQENNQESWEQPNPAGNPGSQAEPQSTGPSPVERAAGAAREQAGEAADALRHGELMRDVAVDPNASGDDRLIALLCYGTQVLIPAVMPIIVLLSASGKQRPFQRYHAVQSLALTVVFVGLTIAALIGTGIIQIVPLIGGLVGLVMLCLGPIAYLMAVAALVYYGYQAYQGKRFAIPGLTSFLQDQNWL